MDRIGTVEFNEESQMVGRVRSLRWSGGRAYFVWGCAALLAVVTGCAQPSKDGQAKTRAPAGEQTSAAKTAEKAPPTTAEKQPAGQTTEKPQPVAQAAPKAAEPAPKAAQPAANPAPPAPKAAEPVAETAKPAPPAAQPAQAATADTNERLRQAGFSPGQESKLSSEADRDALVALIKEQALAMQQQAQRDGTAAPEAPRPAPAPVPLSAAQAQDAKATPPPAGETDQSAKLRTPVSNQPAQAAQPAAKPGCGATGEPLVDVTPPPPDQPQPKLVVKQLKVKSDDVWTAKQATFVWELSNEGEGPLAIRLRGG